MQTLRVGIEDVVHPKPDEIHEELERILASSEFHVPGRGRRFLEFVVEETLAGRSECLKAYTIAQEVFAREASFDAQNDPVVRIEAGRIRRALERYYLVAGRGDAVVVTIPKGGYVPSFRYVATAAPQDAPAAEEPAAPEPAPRRIVHAPAAGRSRYRYALPAALALLIAAALLHGPLAQPPVSVPGSDGARTKVVVEPFIDIGAESAAPKIAQGLMDEVIGQLAGSKEIVVLARQDGTAEATPTTRLFALQGSVWTEGEKLRMIVRLVRAEDGAVLWANSYDADLGAQAALQVQADTAQRIATAIERLLSGLPPPA